MSSKAPIERKQLLNRIGNWALSAAALWAVVTLGWRWFHRDARVGLTPAPFVAANIQGTRVSLPPRDGRPSILIFWATWCGPCRIELARFRSAVKSGELPPDRIFAISVGEDVAEVREYAREHDLPFPVIVDSDDHSDASFSVRVTPTVFHLNSGGEIAWVSEGVHPLSVKQARSHLGQ